MFFWFYNPAMFVIIIKILEP